MVNTERTFTLSGVHVEIIVTQHAVCVGFQQLDPDGVQRLVAVAVRPPQAGHGHLCPSVIFHQCKRGELVFAVVGVVHLAAGLQERVDRAGNLPGAGIFFRSGQRPFPREIVVDHSVLLCGKVWRYGGRNQKNRTP